VLPPLRKWTTVSHSPSFRLRGIVVGRQRSQRPRRRPRSTSRLERPLLPHPRREPTLVIFYQHTWMMGLLFAQGYRNYEAHRHLSEENRPPLALPSSRLAPSRLGLALSRLALPPLVMPPLALPSLARRSPLTSPASISSRRYTSAVSNQRSIPLAKTSTSWA
jgi:hypothetical protein